MIDKRGQLSVAVILAAFFILSAGALLLGDFGITGLVVLDDVSSQSVNNSISLEFLESAVEFLKKND